MPAYAAGLTRATFNNISATLPGNTGRHASSLAPCGTLISSTMMAMMIASTPSLNASSRFFCIRAKMAGATPG